MMLRRRQNAAKMSALPSFRRQGTSLVLPNLAKVRLNPNKNLADRYAFQISPIAALRCLRGGRTPSPEIIFSSARVLRQTQCPARWQYRKTPVSLRKFLSPPAATADRSAFARVHSMLPTSGIEYDR